MQDLVTNEILNRIENGYCEVLGAGVSNVPLVKWLAGPCMFWHWMINFMKTLEWKSGTL